MTEIPALRLSAPASSMRSSQDGIASSLARLVASGCASTRAELVRVTGLARSTVTAGLSSLEGIGLLEVGGQAASIGRGRPGELLRIAPGFGAIAAVEIGSDSTCIALYDFGQHQLASAELETNLSEDPIIVTEAIAASVESMLRGVPTPLPLRSMVVSAAAPVDVQRGVIVAPPYLASWDGFALGPQLAEALGCPVSVRNETDLRALGEARRLGGEAGSLVYLRISEGVGTGYIDERGAVVTGTDGAAGEISHFRALGRAGLLCTCGATDHLNSYASEAAMLDRWRASDPSRAHDDFHALDAALRRRDAEATRIAVDAAREVGAALAQLILILNPAHISVGGRIVESSDAVLATIRAEVYETGLPLATRNLTITTSPLGEQIGLRGGLVQALEESLSAEQVGEHIARRRLAASRTPRR